MTIATEAKFSVGGVLFDQPFKIRRLGHFGINAYRMSDALFFYRDLLGFRITDIREMAAGRDGKVPEAFKSFGDLSGYFFRYAHDHHAFVLYNHRLRQATDRTGFFKDDVTINQITWQVGSLAEVVGGDRWFRRNGEKVVRSGRDMPGSNWHSYLMDPDLHKNEIYYGMEQIGWDGRSKPWDMHDREFDHAAELPQISEYEEVNQAAARGSDLLSGYRDTENLPLTYDVQGILLARPFKIVKHGPVNLFVEDIERSVAWYRQTLGFTVTEETRYEGQRCVFLRNNTEHHSLALLPVVLRKTLGLRTDTTTASFGLQLGSYQQLLNAIDFLKSHGVEFRELPQELTPGMDHTILALDPDGHAMQLYWSMEQIGWDGKPRPASARRTIAAGAWPKTLAANADSFAGEPFLGPLG
ncbi:MAG TPA: VOC family protein [Stellaceae bacterium]|nr:VOC family protein [Stellaceae bacterium]